MANWPTLLARVRSGAFGSKLKGGPSRAFAGLLQKLARFANFQCRLKGIWNLVATGYFNYVISVTAPAREEMERSDSVRPNLINSAYFENKVLVLATLVHRRIFSMVVF